MEEARDLRRERDALAQQAALLHGQVHGAPSAARANGRSRHET